MLKMNLAVFTRILFLSILGASSALLAFACGDDAEPTAIVLPTATPGALPITPTPTIYQDDDDGQLQVGFHIGFQGFAQQGAGVLAQTERGMTVKITVLPAPGTIQQVSIRQGNCENWGNLDEFRWVATLDPAIGGVSETVLPDRHISTILDGNHSVAVSIPGGTFSQVATCGDLPDATHLEIPETLEG